MQNENDGMREMSSGQTGQRPQVGLSYRAALGGWIRSQPEEIECLEVIAEHFFEGPDDLLLSLAESYPLFVHGLGLSLGTPGALHQETLRHFERVVRLADPKWISEHVAFTRSDEVDLGHLNPIAPTKTTLDTFVEHARELSEVCRKPLILENITSFLQLAGEMSEPEFLNRLCERANCGLLLDVTNLWINSRNHQFDPLAWLDELEQPPILQLHVVGYSYSRGLWRDSHAEPIQDELYDLTREILNRFAVDAMIIERDADLPPVNQFQAELRHLAKLGAACSSPAPDRGSRKVEVS